MCAPLQLLLHQRYLIDSIMTRKKPLIGGHNHTVTYTSVTSVKIIILSIIILIVIFIIL